MEKQLASRLGHLFRALDTNWILTFQTKKSLAHAANRHTIPRLSSLYFGYLSREFPRTMLLAEYHTCLESTYFTSILLEDSYLMMRYAISTGQNLPMYQFATVLRQTPGLNIRHCVSHHNLHKHHLCGHQNRLQLSLTHPLLPSRGIKSKRLGGTAQMQLACHLVTLRAASFDSRRNTKFGLEQKWRFSGTKKLAKSAMDCIWFSSLANGAVNCKSSLIVTNPH
jgi:hypothetical protein